MHPLGYLYGTKVRERCILKLNNQNRHFPMVIYLVLIRELVFMFFDSVNKMNKFLCISHQMLGCLEDVVVTHKD